MKKSLLYTRTGDAGTTSLIGGQRIAKNSPRVSAYGSVDELNAMIGLVQAHCTDLDDFVTSTLLTINNTLFNIGAYLATPSATKEATTPQEAAASVPLPAATTVSPEAATAPDEASTPQETAASAPSTDPDATDPDAATDPSTAPDEASAPQEAAASAPSTNPDAASTPSTTPQETAAEPDSPIAPRLLSELEHQIDLLDSSVPQLRQFVLPGGSVAAAHAHVARTVCRRAERDILTLADTGAYVHPAVLTYINRLSDYLFILASYINHFTGHPELTWKQ